VSDRGPIETKRRPDWAALSIAAFLLVIAGVIVRDMMRLPPPGRYDPLGPSGFPYLVAGGLVILAVGLVWDASRGNFPTRERQDFLPVLFVIGGLVLQMALLKPLGFSVATGLMFAAVAYGFGEKRLYLSIPAGLILSAFVWVIFARFLKLTLPEGPPEHWMLPGITWVQQEMIPRIVQAVTRLTGAG
jgi:putative tricarboxylic transport membrane protein